MTISAQTQHANPMWLVIHSLNQWRIHGKKLH